MASPRAKQFLRIAVSALLLFIVYRKVDIGALLETFAGANPLYLFLLFAILYLNTVISAWKWSMLLKADGIRLPLIKLVNSYLIGTFMNLFLPSNIGGDAYRVIDVGRKSKRTAHTFASVLVDRLSGFVALVTIAGVFGLIGYRILPAGNVLLLPVIAMAGLAVMIGFLLEQKTARRILAHRRFDKLEAVRSLGGKLLDSVAIYRRSPGLFRNILAISFLFQAHAVLFVLVLARALNLDIPVLSFFIFVPLISLLEALPISIYGLGLRDAGYAFFFGAVGVARADALSLAVAYVLTTLVYSLSGGVIFLWRSIRGNRPTGGA